MRIGKRNITRQGQARIRGEDNWGKNTSPNSRFRPAASHGAVAPLQVGWALKPARKKTMFSESHWRGGWEKGRPLTGFAGYAKS